MALFGKQFGSCERSIDCVYTVGARITDKLLYLPGILKLEAAKSARHDGTCVAGLWFS
jgi:hypothetical protein